MTKDEALELLDEFCEWAIPRYRSLGVRSFIDWAYTEKGIVFEKPPSK